MRSLYSIGVRGYGAAIRLVSIFQPKAKAWIDGRKNWEKRLSEKVSNDKVKIWFHCASVGEFEQARPVLESLYGRVKNTQIVVTFFSPSGYEQYKDYPYAEILDYLPLDTTSNANKFLDIVNPSLALFVKYEFWFNYIEGILQRDIPIAVFSATFRSDHIFFKPYGKWALDLLKGFDRIFIQDSASAKILKDFGVVQFEVIGDTRFDRVYEIANSIEEDRILTIFNEFSKGKLVVVCGSSWGTEDEFLTDFINQNKNLDCKYIIAPHEIETSKVQKLKANIDASVSLFSELSEEAINSNVIIVDGIGYLSRLYKYGDIAIVGGGFNSGIHNTLEPAAFGMPILFGPKYEKYLEAVALIEEGVGICFSDYSEFEQTMIELISNETKRNELRIACASFVKKNIGASSVISEYTIEKMKSAYRG